MLVVIRILSAENLPADDCITMKEAVESRKENGTDTTKINVVH